MKKIAVLVGTSRKGNYTEKVVNYVLSKIKDTELEATLVSPSEYLLSAQTGRVNKELENNNWAKIMKESEGLIIISPEYNHGYPGELKLMLDQLYDEYLGKPVLVCGVSDGDLGGARMVENLLPVLVTLGLYPLRKGVYFSGVDKLFDENGNILNENIEMQLKKGFEKLSEYLKLLEQ